LVFVIPGAALEAAEKVGFQNVLKGRSLGAPYTLSIFCHSEAASAVEESAFQTFGAACQADPMIFTPFILMLN
jgi:hypothetical protein